MYVNILKAVFAVRTQYVETETRDIVNIFKFSDVQIWYLNTRVRISETGVTSSISAFFFFRRLCKIAESEY